MRKINTGTQSRVRYTGFPVIPPVSSKLYERLRLMSMPELQTFCQKINARNEATFWRNQFWTDVFVALLMAVNARYPKI